MSFNKPDHPAAEYVYDQGSAAILTFKVGGYQKVPTDVEAAATRIAAALADLREDIAAIKGWDGNLSFHAPVSKLVNPKTTDEMIAEFSHAALKANPDCRVVDFWRNSSSGVHGVSVRIAHKT